MHELTAVGFLLITSPNAKHTIKEASGVCVRDGELLVVCNENDGRFFRVDISELEAASTGNAVPIAHADVAGVFASEGTDLESIGILVDGRVVALSEDNHCIIDEHGIVATYGDITREHANRGLEGLAVRRAMDGRNEVAILWEGGYPKRKRLSKDDVGDARRPFILTHTIDAPASSLSVGELDARLITLDPPPSTGTEPGAMRWRAPDLVWHEGGHGVAFIVLLAQRTNEEGTRRHGPSVLQRYDGSGGRIGDPVVIPDMDADGNRIEPGPSVPSRTNWEGLAWLEPGKKLVLVNDADEPEHTVALVVDLPDGW